jgi:hypothetical protein
MTNNPFSLKASCKEICLPLMSFMAMSAFGIFVPMGKAYVSGGVSSEPHERRPAMAKAKGRKRSFFMMVDLVVQTSSICFM